MLSRLLKECQIVIYRNSLLADFTSRRNKVSCSLPTAFFERMNSVEIRKKSSISSLYPTTKLIACACLVLLAFILPTYVERLSLLVVIHLLALLNGKYRDFVKISIFSVGILMFFIVFIQSFFYQGANPTVLYEIGAFSIKLEGIMRGLNIGSSILVFGSSILLFFQTTEIKDLMYSLEVKGLNSKASYVILATLQMIPQMHKNSQVIMSAQKSRGVETEGNLIVRAKAFIPVLAPLVLSSIANTEGVNLLKQEDFQLLYKKHI